MNPDSPVTDSCPRAQADLRRRGSATAWMRGLCAGSVLAALSVLSVPALSEVEGKADRVQSLARVRQVGICLKLFAMDNAGLYPRSGTPANLREPATSNAAFAPLLPIYTQSETIFGDTSSAYQTREPDNVVDKVYTGKPVKTLEPGENVYGYMAGLTTTASGRCPLIFDGTAGQGYYSSDPRARGGVGAGLEVIVIRVDNSGRFESLGGPPNLRFVPLGDALAKRYAAEPDDNLLDAKLYGPDVRLLEPAVDPAGRH